MIFTLSLPWMFLGACGQLRTYDYPTLADCEKARLVFSEKAVGSGYVICATKKELLK